MQTAALRVKIKSLAEEARIIRLEERRAKGRRVSPGVFLGRDDKLWWSLNAHRTWDVRNEARSSILAYAFIRGRSYAACERPAKDNPPDLKRVLHLVEKYGAPVGGVPKYKCPDGVLAAWVAGTLAEHPFAAKTG